MSPRFRESLARWISPELAAVADKDERLRNEMRAAYRWLSEFDQICTFIEWLNGTERDFYRSLNRAPVCELPANIGEFREYLRKRTAKLEAQP